MKSFLLSGLGVVCIVIFAAAGTPGSKHPLEFTLATTDTDPSPTSLTLAPRLAGALATAGPLGLGLIEDSVGPYRTAIGWEALFNNTGPGGNPPDGYWNTASGCRALYSNTTGSWNTAIGHSAGNSCTTGWFNIYLGAGVGGSPSDTNTIRIGSSYNSNNGMGQYQTFIAGIVESPLSTSASPVGITNDGRLGTIPSESLPGSPVTGSLLLLVAGATVPSGYSLIGSTEISITAPGAKKITRLTINVYQKN